MMTLRRMRTLAGLQEAQQIEPPEDDDARYDREQKIKRLIVLAFKRIDLTIAEGDYSDADIYYDEASGREAIVLLDDSQVSLDRLDALKRTGLAATYVISASRNGLSVMFSVDPGLDNAVL
jgi:hypothetical protein